MRVLGIIPARYSSTRLPGKPLAILGTKLMIQHVYERALSVLSDIVIATDDERIFDAARKFNANVVMTSPNHNSGTERCAEALQIFENLTNKYFDAVINIQGDEPLIEPEAIEKLIELLSLKEVQIATLANKTSFIDELNNPNRVKVVLNKFQNALYFSRSLIPFVRNQEYKGQLEFYIHVGIYGYKKETLLDIVKLEPTMLEKAESLEQNRWLEHGYKIKVGITTYKSISVDTPEDLENIKKYFN